MSMTKSKIMRCCLCFAGGAVTLMLVLILLFLIDTRGGKNIPLTGVRCFGDVRIWTKQAPAEAGGKLDLGKGLYMSKSGKAFLVLLANASGNNVNTLCLLDREGNIILTVSSDPETGQWKRLIYRRYREKTVMPGEVYLDLNVDGRFDSKYTVDNTGKITDRCIYTGEKWIKVDEINENDVMAEGKRYIFDMNSGEWHPK